MSSSLVDLSRPIVVVIAVIGLIVAVFLIVPTTLSLIVPPPGVESSTYGYSVSIGYDVPLGTSDASLRNLTLYLPLPVSANGSSPIAESIRAGDLDAPDTWRYSVVETDRGLMLHVEAEEIRVEGRTDEEQYADHRLGLSVSAGHVIDTGDPYGSEPTVAPVEGRRVRPCPNQAGPDPDQTCFDYDVPMYVAYDAPPDARVSIRLIHNAVNSYEPPRRDIDMYYERLYVVLEEPRDGWIEVRGYASVEEARN